MKLFLYIGVILLWGFALPRIGLAQDDDVDQGSGIGELMDSADASKLEWGFAVYAWAINLEGDVGIANVQAPLDLKFKDIFNSSDTLIPFMGAVSVSAEEWSLFFHPTYVHVGFKNEPSRFGLVDVKSDITANLGWFELGGSLHLIKDHTKVRSRQDAKLRQLDVYGGARITLIDFDVEADASVGGIPIGSAQQRENVIWVEPFVGLSGRYEVVDGLVVNLRGDVGGFGAGSDFAWQAVGNVVLDVNIFRNPTTLFLGYRALSQDYSSDDFKWDVVAHGPFNGMTIRF